MFVPDESQICNPIHLQALIQACENTGTRFVSNCSDLELQFTEKGARLSSVTFQGQTENVDQVFVCVGAWSTELLSDIGIELPIVPVRGQMVLYKLDEQPFAPILNEGARYIVPRVDGHVVVGSTTEEAGFDESTTDEEIASLKEFANRLVPALTPERVLKTWAGLRPASCLLYTSPSPRDATLSRMPSSA